MKHLSAPKGICYYDPILNWPTIERHLDDQELNKLLCRDFGLFYWAQVGEPFRQGQFPYEAGPFPWWDVFDDLGPPQTFWKYVELDAHHYLVNFNLRLAMLTEPKRPWRILTSREHSTVWDGHLLLFDFAKVAFGAPPEETFQAAAERELEPGQYLPFLWQTTLHLSAAEFMNDFVRI